MPATVADWENIATEFGNIWNFPMCLGALDGKHIEFRPPRKDGSLYYNYKKSHSIVLLAVVDARYRFLYINVGVNGRVGDGGVFRDSDFNRALQELNLPQDKPLPGRNKTVPYVFVGDDAFPLQEHLLKPYAERGMNKSRRIFNYRLSRARRMSENAFGILANRFRVFLTKISLNVKKVELLVLAACALHNFLRESDDSQYLSPSLVDNDEMGVFVPGSWRMESHLLGSIGRQGGNRHSVCAAAVRDEYTCYFVEEGRLPWQESQI